MPRFKEGDLVAAMKNIRFLLDKKVLMEVPQGTYGVVRRAGNKISVKFRGYNQCTVSPNEIQAANPLDKMAWDFGEMDERPIKEPESEQ